MTCKNHAPSIVRVTSKDSHTSVAICLRPHQQSWQQYWQARRTQLVHKFVLLLRCGSSHAQYSQVALFVRHLFASSSTQPYHNPWRLLDLQWSNSYPHALSSAAAEIPPSTTDCSTFRPYEGLQVMENTAQSFKDPLRVASCCNNHKSCGCQLSNCRNTYVCFGPRVCRYTLYRERRQKESGGDDSCKFPHQTRRLCCRNVCKLVLCHIRNTWPANWPVYSAAGSVPEKIANTGGVIQEFRLLYIWRPLLLKKYDSFLLNFWLGRHL